MLPGGRFQSSRGSGGAEMEPSALQMEGGGAQMEPGGAQMEMKWSPILNLLEGGAGPYFQSFGARRNSNGAEMEPGFESRGVVLNAPGGSF